MVVKVFAQFVFSIKKNAYLIFIFPLNEKKRNASSWKLVKNLIYNIYFQQESKPHRIVKTFYASIIK